MTKNRDNSISMAMIRQVQELAHYIHMKGKGWPSNEVVFQFSSAILIIGYNDNVIHLNNQVNVLPWKKIDDKRLNNLHASDHVKLLNHKGKPAKPRIKMLFKPCKE